MFRMSRIIVHFHEINCNYFQVDLSYSNRRTFKKNKRRRFKPMLPTPYMHLHLQFWSTLRTYKRIYRLHATAGILNKYFSKIFLNFLIVSWLTQSVYFVEVNNTMRKNYTAKL